MEKRSRKHICTILFVVVLSTQFYYGNTTHKKKQDPYKQNSYKKNEGLYKVLANVMHANKNKNLDTRLAIPPTQPLTPGTRPTRPTRPTPPTRPTRPTNCPCNQNCQTCECPCPPNKKSDSGILPKWLRNGGFKEKVESGKTTKRDFMNEVLDSTLYSHSHSPDKWNDFYHNGAHYHHMVVSPNVYHGNHMHISEPHYGVNLGFNDFSHHTSLHANEAAHNNAEAYPGEIVSGENYLSKFISPAVYDAGGRHFHDQQNDYEYHSDHENTQHLVNTLSDFKSPIEFANGQDVVVHTARHNPARHHDSESNHEEQSTQRHKFHDEEPRYHDDYGYTDERESQFENHNNHQDGFHANDDQHGDQDDYRGDQEHYHGDMNGDFQGDRREISVKEHGEAKYYGDQQVNDGDRNVQVENAEQDVFVGTKENHLNKENHDEQEHLYEQERTRENAEHSPMGEANHEAIAPNRDAILFYKKHNEEGEAERHSLEGKGDNIFQQKDDVYSKFTPDQESYIKEDFSEGKASHYEHSVDDGTKHFIDELKDKDDNSLNTKIPGFQEADDKDRESALEETHREGENSNSEKESITNGEYASQRSDDVSTNNDLKEIVKQSIMHDQLLEKQLRLLKKSTIRNISFKKKGK